MAYFNNQKRNTPVATLIKNYIDKKSGKVDESRKEILIRFDYLDWKDQKKILSAFLDSGKTDRRWAYTKLLNYWDKIFEPKLKELRESYHEERCSWPVIRYFPVEYIKQNLDKFTEEKDYYHVCLRLAQDKSFHIDKDKLAPADYLSVVFESDRTISDEEAKDILFKLVHKYCIERKSISTLVLDNYALNYDCIISPKHFKEVSRARNYLQQLNLTLVVSEFDKWDENVQNKIEESPEFSKVTRYSRIFDDRIRIAYKYSYLALDEKYKEATDPDAEMMFQPSEFYRIIDRLDYDNPPF